MRSMPSAMSEEAKKEALDPMTESHLEEQKRQDWEKSLPKAERRKLIRERQKNAERRGRRALYDLPSGLIKAVASIAEEARMTNSQVAGIFLLHALREYHQGKINLRDYRQPSASPRYDYRVDLDKLFESWDYRKPV
jgi:hypothetical protein